jgi:hypothetical protein
MADLSQLYKVAPLTAAFMTGGQQALDDDTQTTKTRELQQLIQKYQIENQQSQIMNPLLAAHQGLANDSLSAQIPGQRAQSQTLQQTADIGAATMPGVIAKTNATNAASTQKAGLQSASDMTKFLTDSAGELDNVPAPARMGYLSQKLLAGNQNPNDPKVAATLRMLSQLPPDQLPNTLRKMASTLNSQQPAYQQAVDTTKITADAHERAAAGNNAATIKAAQIAADSRLSVAQTRNQQKSALDALVKSKNYAGAAAVAKALAMSETDPDRKEQLEQYATLMAAQDLAHQQAGGSNPNKINGPALAGLPPAVTNNPMARPDSPAPANPLTGGGVGGFEEKAKQAWGAYEPTKYDYRVGPNGVLQRKPKG